MGDFKAYNPAGGFDQYLYYKVGDTVTASNGVQGKVIDEYSVTETGRFHSSLPVYSNTSEVYFKKSDKGGHPVEQARVYIGRKAALDFDWGHTHGKYGKGVVHVHEWYQDGMNNWSRSDHPRCMNDRELRRYGELIKRANPNARLRP